VRVTEVLGTDPAPYESRDVFGYRQHGVRNGTAFGEFYATGYRPRLVEKLHAMGIELPEETFRERVWEDT
jgi:pilus assembly protein CpaF